MDIGIDLGTTYSCVMHHGRDGVDELIRSTDGKEITPSVVCFEADGSVLVGDAAKRQLRMDPDNVVVGIKRHMGTSFDLEFHGIRYTPEAISGIILKRLVMDAQDHFGARSTSLRAVITVPAYFGVAEKEATYAAARIAGIDCLELLAEPVAAVYAYGVEKAGDGGSLVFDLGGGTFDVAVVGMADRRPRIWAVDGETRLGGLDWDQRMFDLLWERLVTQGIDEGAEFDEDFAAALSTEAELLKRNLSVREAGKVRIRYDGRMYTVSVTRSAFEEATSDLVIMCIEAAKRVLATARELGARSVERVLLVGGSTRMPMIRAALEAGLGLPVIIHDPDKAVARGAAVLASMVGANKGAGQYRSAGILGPKTVAPVLPKAIGIKLYSSSLPVRPEPYVCCIIPQNTLLPVVKKRVTVATALSKQSKARIELYEQAGVIVSDEIEGNRLLFDGEVTGIASAPAGSPIHLDVSVSIEGRIEVEAVDGSTGKTLRVDAFIHGVVDEGELAEQTDNVSGLMVL